MIDLPTALNQADLAATASTSISAPGNGNATTCSAVRAGFRGCSVVPKKLRITGLQPGKIQFAAGLFGPDQKHPKLHDIAQVEVLLLQNPAQLVEHRNSLQLSISVGGRRTRRGVWVSEVRQGAADEYQAGRGRDGHGHGLGDRKIADAGALNAVAHGVSP